MSTAIVVIRVLLTFFGAALAFGILMFISTNKVASLGVPLAIIILAAAPARAGAPSAMALGIGLLLMTGTYIMTGVPFLADGNLDAEARGFHFAAFLAVIGLSSYRIILWRRGR